MKILLYDRQPDSHHVDVSQLKELGLCRHEPGAALPDLKDFSAVALHVTDEVHFKQGIASLAIKQSLPIVLYSGQYSIASDRKAALMAEYPTAHVCSVMVEDLFLNLKRSLTQNDLEQLCWDGLSDAIEILSTLWALGIAWETNGSPEEFRRSHGEANMVGAGTLTRAVRPDGKFDLEELLTLETTDGRNLSDLISRVYGRTTRPNKDLRLLEVSSPVEYYQGLASLRDSLLTWAQRST